MLNKQIIKLTQHIKLYNETTKYIRSLGVFNLKRHFTNSSIHYNGKDDKKSSFFQGKDLEEVLKEAEEEKRLKEERERKMKVVEERKIKEEEKRLKEEKDRRLIEEQGTKEEEEKLNEILENKTGKIVNEDASNKRKEINKSYKMEIKDDQKREDKAKSNDTIFSSEQAKVNLDKDDNLKFTSNLMNEYKLIIERAMKKMEDTKEKTKQTLEPFKQIPWKKIAEDPKQFISSAGQAINDATGYAQIEELKRKIETTASDFEEAKVGLRKAKEDYQKLVEIRANGQRNINELLQRKHSWNDKDVTLFTQLYRDEHQNESLELEAKQQCKEYEEKVEKLYSQLVSDIRTRYHEEQLWSDKIRGASTYWTLALIMINMVLFLAVHTMFEPRKRGKLVEKVDIKIKEQFQTERGFILGHFDILNKAFNYQNEELKAYSDKLDEIERLLNNNENEKKGYFKDLMTQVLNKKENNISINDKFNITQDQIYLSIISALVGASFSLIIRSCF